MIREAGFSLGILLAFLLRGGDWRICFMCAISAPRAIFTLPCGHMLCNFLRVYEETANVDKNSPSFHITRNGHEQKSVHNVRFEFFL